MHFQLIDQFKINSETNKCLLLLLGCKSQAICHAYPAVCGGVPAPSTPVLFDETIDRVGGHAPSGLLLPISCLQRLTFLNSLCVNVLLSQHNGRY